MSSSFEVVSIFESGLVGSSVTGSGTKSNSCGNSSAESFGSEPLGLCGSGSGLVGSSVTGSGSSVTGS